MSRAVIHGVAVLALTTLPSVVSADPTQATASIRPKARGPAGLPLPPAEGDYVEWLHGQAQDVQLRINRYCSAHAYNYETVCGGIGPLHIPEPPPWDACEGGDPAAGGPPGIRVYPPRKEGEKPRTRWEWRKDMTKDQQHYTDQKCKFARRDTDLCGPAVKPHCNTPLVVSFDDRPVTFQPGARFSFAPGIATATDWPTADTPWIALDLDGDGAITSGAELFGDHTALPGGTTAKNGFEALAALDANHDGKIDAADPGFAKLVLWSDRDRDGRGAADELAPLATGIGGRSIVSISLAAHGEARCDARGNCEGQRTRITWRDATGLHTGTVIDVYMPTR
jgi:hypothetical protein